MSEPDIQEESEESGEEEPPSIHSIQPEAEHRQSDPYDFPESLPNPEESASLIAEENCDEVINELISSVKSDKIRKQSSAHEPGCPLYEEEEEEPEVDGPCPPGVRRCCTCGVCPLDKKDTGKKKGDKKDEAFLGSGDSQSTLLSSGKSKTSSKGTSDLYDEWKEWMKRYGEGGEGYSGGAGEAGDMLRYYSPAMSDRSQHEGSFVEDYMKLLIEPYICYKTLSSLSSSYLSCVETGLQRTIVIVKPQAVMFKEAVYRVIFEAGFQILGVRVVHLTPEQVSEIYSKYYGSPSFVHLVVTVSEAPSLAICISAINVIEKWLKIIGPDGSLRAEWFYPLSMRKMFGLQDTHADWIHGSENLKASNKENRYFYPDAIIDPIVQEEEKVWDYCGLNINKTLLDACTEVVKKRPADPILFLADYLLLHNPFQPRFPRDIALTPT